MPKGHSVQFVADQLDLSTDAVFYLLNGRGLVAIDEGGEITVDPASFGQMKASKAHEKKLPQHVLNRSKRNKRP